jgi:hypothetical protein
MRKMKSIVLTLAVLIGMSSEIFSQSSINNISFNRTASKGEIVENNKIVGYYYFAFKDKADKKNNIYEVNIFDDNYNKVKSFEITRPKRSLLLEMVFNGEVFLLHFLDKKGYEFVTFDKNGKMLGSSLVPKKEIAKIEMQMIQLNINSGSENLTIFSNGSEGFVRANPSKTKYTGFQVVGYDNYAKPTWKYLSDPNSSQLEYAGITDIAGGIVSLSITKKKNKMTQVINMFSLILDSESGEKIVEMELGNNEKGRLSLLKSFVNVAEKKILLVGEYYAPKDDIIKDKSEGLFLKELSMKGKEVTMKKYGWKTDIAKFNQKNLDEEDKKDTEKSFRIFFHDVVFTKDGHLFLVGEQFKKQISAGGVALKAVGTLTGNSSNASAFEVRVANMAVIELDKDYKLVAFDLIQKKKSSVLLPNGAGFMSTQALGYYIKSTGQFDYSFTSKDVDNDKFSVVYNDLDRKETKDAKRSDTMLGVISINGTERKNERVPINSDARTYSIQAAKPGYIAIIEIFRKEKRVDFRMEQIAY